MMFAFHRMNNYYGSVITGKIYEKLRNKFSDYMKNSIKMINTQTNTTHMIRKDEIHYYLNNGYIVGSTERTNKNKVYINNGEKNRLVEKLEANILIDCGWSFGRFLKQETRNRIGKSSKTRALDSMIISNIKTKETFKIKVKDLNNYCSSNYIKGYIDEKCCVTNGIDNKRINSIDSDFWLQKGWTLGMTISKDSSKKHSDCLRNITKNSICMYNLELDKEVKIKEDMVDFYKNNGFVFGRRNTPTKGRKWVFKEGITKTIRKEDLQDYLESGWSYGRSKK